MHGPGPTHVALHLWLIGAAFCLSVVGAAGGLERLLHLSVRFDGVGVEASQEPGMGSASMNRNRAVRSAIVWSAKALDSFRKVTDRG